jgi:hypothetical protein
MPCKFSAGDAACHTQCAADTRHPNTDCHICVVAVRHMMYKWQQSHGKTLLWQSGSTASRAQRAELVVFDAGTRNAFCTHLQFLQKELRVAVHASHVVPKQLHPLVMYASSACIRCEVGKHTSVGSMEGRDRLCCMLSACGLQSTTALHMSCEGR